MAQNDQVEVNCKDKIFRPIHNSDCEIKVATMNIISSSTELFEVLKEEELMGFIDVLANEYAFASEHPVGRKIWEIIRDWNKFMDFDKEYYYHGRAKKMDLSIQVMRWGKLRMSTSPLDDLTI